MRFCDFVAESLGTGPSTGSYTGVMAEAPSERHRAY